MSDYVDDLADFIIGASAASGAAAATPRSPLVLVGGTNLFAGKRTDDNDVADLAVFLTGYEGLVDESFGPDGDLEIPNLQVTVRSARGEYKSAEQLAWWLHRAIHSITERQVGTTYIHRCRSRSTPNPLGEDSLNRFLFAMDFSVMTPATVVTIP